MSEAADETVGGNAPAEDDATTEDQTNTEVERTTEGDSGSEAPAAPADAESSE